MVEHLSRERIISVSAGQYHSLALADDGRSGTYSSIAIGLMPRMPYHHYMFLPPFQFTSYNNPLL
jgi:hypothetical protein